MKNPAVPARLDKDRTAKPLTRIIHHPPAGACQGSRTTLVEPELEDENGDRTPLIGSETMDERTCRYLLDFNHPFR